MLICHLLRSSQTNREPHVSCLVRSTVQPKKTSRNWMDLPRIVTMQAALLVGEPRTGTCADPGCTSAAQFGSWCGVSATRTRIYTAYYRWSHLWRTALNWPCVTPNCMVNFTFSITKLSRFTLRNEKKLAKLSYINWQFGNRRFAAVFTCRGEMLRGVLSGQGT